jgi:hypothetical protein
VVSWRPLTVPVVGDQVLDWLATAVPRKAAIRNSSAPAAILFIGW